MIKLIITEIPFWFLVPFGRKKGTIGTGIASNVNITES